MYLSSLFQFRQSTVSPVFTLSKVSLKCVMKFFFSCVIVKQTVKRVQSINDRVEDVI